MFDPRERIVERLERIVSDEEMDELINFGPDCYQKAGSPPLVFAEGPALADGLSLKWQAGSVKYCEKDDDSAESLLKKVFSALLGKNAQ